MSWMKRFAEAIGPSRSEDQGTEMTATVNSVDDDGKAYVCMAGDSRPVPAVRTAVMVSPGDTVRGKLVKGRFTIEGNLTDNAVGSTHLEKAKEHVLESAHASLKVLDDKIEMSVEDLENGMRSSITETAEEIRSEVEATYLSKEDAEEDYLSQEDAIEVYASKSLVSQTAQSITSEVSSTYVSKSDAETTYATKSSLQQTSTALTAIIDDAVKKTTQLWYAKANSMAPNKPNAKVTQDGDVHGQWTAAVPTFSSSYKYYFYCYQQELISGSVLWSDVVADNGITDAQSAAEVAQTVADSANALATTLSTYVRMVSGYGLLVTYTGYTVGALVRSSGSFDIVKLTWSNGVPTIGDKLSTHSAYDESGATGGSFSISPNETVRMTGVDSGGQSPTVIGRVSAGDSNSTIVNLYLNATSRVATTGITINQTALSSQGTISFNFAGTTAVRFSGTPSANTVLAAPNGSDGTATFRSLVAADIPSLNASKIGSGTLDASRIPSLNASKIGDGKIPIEHGGTNATTASAARSNLGIFPDVRTGGTDFGSDKSVTSDNTWTRIGTASFAAGTWLIITRFTFKPSTTTDGSERWCAGYVGDLVETNPNVNVLESGYANNTSNYVVFTVISLRTYTGSSGTTVYAHAKKKGSNQKVTATYRAIRLY